jgi:arsenate reductase
MGLKEKMDILGEAEALELLASNGKLIKRPIAFDGKKATVGFREEEYRKQWL